MRQAIGNGWSRQKPAQFTKRKILASVIRRISSSRPRNQPNLLFFALFCGALPMA